MPFRQGSSFRPLCAHGAFLRQRSKLIFVGLDVAASRRNPPFQNSLILNIVLESNEIKCAHLWYREKQLRRRSWLWAWHSSGTRVAWANHILEKSWKKIRKFMYFYHKYMNRARRSYVRTFIRSSSWNTSTSRGLRLMERLISPAHRIGHGLNPIASPFI